MPIAVLSYSLHTGCVTTSPEKSLRHNKTDCIITFFPLTGCISHHLQREETAGVHSDEGEGKKKNGTGMSGGPVNTHFFVCVLRHPRRKRAKRQKEQMDGKTERRGERRV